jgi:hypothetical protein
LVVQFGQFFYALLRFIVKLISYVHGNQLLVVNTYIFTLMLFSILKLFNDALVGYVPVIILR